MIFGGFFRVIDLAFFGPFEMIFFPSLGSWVPQDSDDEKVKKKKKSGKAMKRYTMGTCFFK